MKIEEQGFQPAIRGVALWSELNHLEDSLWRNND